VAIARSANGTSRTCAFPGFVIAEGGGAEETRVKVRFARIVAIGYDGVHQLPAGSENSGGAAQGFT
jgi:hypothetical protein